MGSGSIGFTVGGLLGAGCGVDGALVLSSSLVFEIILIPALTSTGSGILFACGS